MEWIIQLPVTFHGVFHWHRTASKIIKLFWNLCHSNRAEICIFYSEGYFTLSFKHACTFYGTNIPTGTTERQPRVRQRAKVAQPCSYPTDFQYFHHVLIKKVPNSNRSNIYQIFEPTIRPLRCHHQFCFFFIKYGPEFVYYGFWELSISSNQRCISLIRKFFFSTGKL